MENIWAYTFRSVDKITFKTKKHVLFISSETHLKVLSSIV